MWRVLVLLRARPHRLDELADMLRVSPRTIRRDLNALRSVPLPIHTRFPVGPDGTRKHIRIGDRNEWFCGEIAAWPAREIAPLADAVAGTADQGTPAQFAHEDFS
jgi:predicted DNA-binding transcriptional regulator YafY